ncbi:nucleotide exchange factor GrpE [Oscillospiraceae bacterium MB08-C2-2]|nr:nucleotide exchange factor GrpE [Oscillospiraceae bacterium MB08-C2-2]
MGHIDDKDSCLETPLEEEIPTCQETEATSQEEAQQPTELELLEKRVAELTDQHLRTMAEYDNFRKRSQREREELFPTATAAAVEKFLPVLDNFERAMEHPCEDSEFLKGIDMIYQSLQGVMDSFGVKAIGVVGEPFDPQRHNAVMHIEDEALGENVVSQVLQKGYSIGDRVIRYAMVQTAN